MKTIDGHYFFWSGFCSNWYESPFTLSGRGFNCVEQYMMYTKAMFFKDEDIAFAVMRTNNPKEQKKLGRQVKGFDAAEWRSVCYELILPGVIEKFKQNPHLKEKLREIKDLVIVEASPYDRIWGIGYHFDDENILKEKANWGENLLGKCLMDAAIAIF